MNDKSDQHRTLVLIGAGSAVFTRGLLADFISAPDLGRWKICLVDINPDALSVTVQLAERMVQARGEEDRIFVRGHGGSRGGAAQRRRRHLLRWGRGTANLAARLGDRT